MEATVGGADVDPAPRGGGWRSSTAARAGSTRAGPASSAWRRVGGEPLGGAADGAALQDAAQLVEVADVVHGELADEHAAVELVHQQALVARAAGTPRAGCRARPPARPDVLLGEPGAGGEAASVMRVRSTSATRPAVLARPVGPLGLEPSSHSVVVTPAHVIGSSIDGLFNNPSFWCDGDHLSTASDGTDDGRAHDRRPDQREQDRPDESAAGVRGSTDGASREPRCRPAGRCSARCS